MQVRSPSYMFDRSQVMVSPRLLSHTLHGRSLSQAAIQAGAQTPWIWRFWENSKVQAGEDSKPLNLATLAPQMAQIWRFWENSKVQAGDDSKLLNLAHFGAPNGSNLAILRKFKGSGRGGFKTVKFSHFGTPNGSDNSDKIQGFRQGRIQNR